jgi:gluconolactonase
MSLATSIRVERLAPPFDDLIPADVSADLPADFGAVEGPHWLEGPAWDRCNNCLLFSDVKANAIYRWDRRDGLRLFIAAERLHRPEPAPMEEPGSNASPLIVRAAC